MRRAQQELMRRQEKQIHQGLETNRNVVEVKEVVLKTEEGIVEIGEGINSIKDLFDMQCRRYEIGRAQDERRHQGNLEIFHCWSMLMSATRPAYSRQTRDLHVDG